MGPSDLTSVSSHYVAAATGRAKVGASSKAPKATGLKVFYGDVKLEKVIGVSRMYLASAVFWSSKEGKAFLIKQGGPSKEKAMQKLFKYMTSKSPGIKLKFVLEQDPAKVPTERYDPYTHELVGS